MATTNETTGNTGLVRNQDFERGATVEPPPGVLLERARGNDFISFHPADELWVIMSVIQDPVTGKHLIVTRDLVESYRSDVKFCHMIPYMHRDGQINIWPLSTRRGPWRETLMDIIGEHGGSWLRVPVKNKTNSDGKKSLGYDCILPPASSSPPPPDWLETPLQIYERIPASSKITNHAHPVLARLRGEHLR